MFKQVILLALLLSTFVGAAFAQDVATITQQIEAVQNNSALDDEARAATIAILNEAKRTAAKASERAATVRGFESTALSASTTINQLRDDLAALGQEASVSLSADRTDNEINLALTDQVAE